MWSRRSFLRLTGAAAGAGLSAARYGIDEVAALTQSMAGRTPAQVAADEDYWREIQFAFTLDRTLINLNNGNQCPSSTVVHEASKRYMDWANQAPVYHRGMIDRNIETARRRLAQSSAPTRRRSPSRATPASRCRSRRWASTSSPATRSSPPSRTTGAC